MTSLRKAGRPAKGVCPLSFASGYVTEGMDVVDAICEDAQPTDDNGTIPAEEQPVITSITISQ